MIVNNLKKIKKTDEGYLIYLNNAKVKITFLTDEIFRMRLSFNKEFKEESYSLIKTAWKDNLDKVFHEERERLKPLNVEVIDIENKIIFNSKTLSLEVNKNPFYITLYDCDKNLVYEDLKERAYEKDHLGRIYHYNKIDRSDYFYGFGEKTGHLNKMGRRMRMATKDAIGHDPEIGDPMYKHIPFYIKVRNDNLKALGFFYDNSYDGVFDIGNEISGYWDSYSYYEADGGDINLFLIYGPTVKEVINKYTFLTGSTILPTKQSLGYCASTMYYTELEENCDEEIYKVIDKHKKEKMYIDNFWLASGYSQGEDGLRYTFNWNFKKFRDPEKFFEKMNSIGINVICNLKPGILKNHPYVDYFEKNNAFIKEPNKENDYYGRWWGGKGRFIDFTSESGRSSWRKLLESNILEKGTKTVWNDNCEIDGIEDRLAYCDNFGLGGDMRNLKAVQSNMMALTGIEAIKNIYPNERPYVINRAGYAGIQRYAQVWGGDNLTSWETLKFNVATIMGMGLSGCANMGCDIGGFAGEAPESELLLRWIQNGIFQPRFCINSANNDNTATQAFMYEENNDYIRKAFNLRYKMMPYLYSLMREAYEYGTPIMRPLFLEFENDRNAYKDKNMTFFFGPSILVANVLEKNSKFREIYFPKGSNFYDINDNLKEYIGGRTYKIKVDRSSIPMFMKDNAIFITSNDIKNITKDTLRTLDILITANKNTKFDFYDDDGHTLDYKKGIYKKTRFNVKIKNSIIEVDVKKEGTYKDTVKNVNIKLLSIDRGAKEVFLDKEKLKRFLVLDEFNNSKTGWYYNLSDKTICIKYINPKKDYKIIVSKEKFDLIGMNDE